jgi:hypothetical protein
VVLRQEAEVVGEDIKAHDERKSYGEMYRKRDDADDKE